MFVVGTAIFAYIVDYISGRQRPLLWVSIITLLVSTALLSRTGTIIAFLLFALVFVYNIKYYYLKYYSNFNISKFKWIIASVSIFAIIIIIFSLISIEVYDSSRYLTEGVMSSSTTTRVKLLQSFAEQMNFKNALLGFKFSDPRFDHLHNSYLMLCTYCGIAAFPVLLFIGYLLFWLSRKNLFITGLFFLMLLY